MPTSGSVFDAGRAPWGPLFGWRIRAVGELTLAVTKGIGLRLESALRRVAATHPYDSADDRSQGRHGSAT